MLPLRFAVATLAVLCTAQFAAAGDVYKCTDAQGSIAFQDHPCAAGANETRLHIAAPPPAPAADAASPIAMAPTPPPASQPVIAPPPPRQPLPPLWLCTNAEDGKQYISRDGVTQQRLVPLGVMGYPGKSLASAYGPGGIGVSAPGMRQIPIDTSPQAAGGGNYTAIQDQCERATREQTCTYLRQQYDQVHEKLRGAFKDEQAVLQPQADELDAQLDGC
jgi:hypothetical protein